MTEQCTESKVTKNAGIGPKTMQKVHFSAVRSLGQGSTPHLGERPATGVSSWWKEELSGDQVFFPRANTCLSSQQIEQTLLQAMAGFEDEEFVEVDNEEEEMEKISPEATWQYK